MENPFTDITQRLTRIEYLLNGFNSQKAPVFDPGSDILNITEAATLLNLTVPSVYGLVHKRVIPFSKRGKRLYFSKSELLDWIKQGRRKTIDEAGSNPEQHLKPLKQRKEVSE